MLEPDVNPLIIFSPCCNSCGIFHTAGGLNLLMIFNANSIRVKSRFFRNSRSPSSLWLNSRYHILYLLNFGFLRIDINRIYRDFLQLIRCKKEGPVNKNSSFQVMILKKRLFSFTFSERLLNHSVIFSWSLEFTVRASGLSGHAALLRIPPRHFRLQRIGTYRQIEFDPHWSCTDIGNSNISR